METPTLAELRQTFADMMQSRCEGVPGVQRIEGKPGPTIALTAMTHGNEPCGLAVFWYLRRHPELLKNLHGHLLLCINNPYAGQKYFASRTREEKMLSRLAEADMNRIPERLGEEKANEPIEHTRVRVLLPVLAQADMGVDFHGFPYEGPPMTIDIKGDPQKLLELSSAIPSSIRVTHMTELQQTKPLGYWVGGTHQHIPVLEVECGQNEEPETFRMAIRSCLAVLIAKGFLEMPHTVEEAEQKMYRVIQAVRFPNASYVMPKPRENMEILEEGEVLATGNGPPVVAPERCVSLFAWHMLKPLPIHLEHEILWLAALPVAHRCKHIRVI